MSIFRYWIFLTTLFLFYTIVYSQDASCFEKLRARGIESYNSKDYEDAIIKWEAAKMCAYVPVGNDLNNWIKKANDKISQPDFKLSVRIDGLYVMREGCLVSTDEECYNCLRFFSDGEFISANIHEPLKTISKINSWFKKGFHNKGRYNVSGRKIKFYFDTSTGSVEYSGYLIDKGIRISWKSHQIDEVKGKYIFVPF